MKLPNKNKVVSVLSGGLDSTILTYMLVDKYGKDNVIALSFNYGQKQGIELEKASVTCKKLNIQHKIIDISFLGDIVAPVCANIKGTDVEMPTIQDVLGDPQPPTYVPYRNMILNSIAFSFAESNDCDAVFSGLQIHDEYGYWDTSRMFIDRMNSVSELNRQHQISFEAPFAEMSKKDEIEIGKELGVIFEDTMTCYNPTEDVACGKCPSCSERIQNFALAGIKDPCKYSIEIPWDDICVQS
jgi:7-cyano-7-deazaguanine synthase